MIDRDYLLFDSEKSKTKGPTGLDNCESLRYAVGQPMGALSSWAMLAVTHHLLTQLAAQKAGRTRPGL